MCIYEYILGYFVPLLPCEGVFGTEVVKLGPGIRGANAWPVVVFADEERLISPEFRSTAVGGGTKRSGAKLHQLAR